MPIAKHLPVLLALLTALPALAAEIRVENAWTRATAPGQKVAGAFMEITADADATLVGAESPVSKVVELHTMAMEDGVMIMRQVREIALPRGRTVSLKPGGLHVMLIDMNGQLREGDRAPLTLLVRDAAGKSQRVAVEAVAMKPGGMRHAH